MHHVTIDHDVTQEPIAFGIMREAAECAIF